ncbi:MAG TPA: efflux transporter outer membrane subunit [Gemmataceae bacterium]|nr:efflux transporter outer membrane subunit [Gemmataceae bacterium]
MAQKACFLVGLVSVAGLVCGCTSLQEYVHNGFKVGPDYGRPPAPVAKEWIDASDKRVRSETDDLSAWWTVFHDPALNSLICRAYQQNLTLREAGFRVLQARAQMLINVGNLFPQTQAMTGDYTRNALSRETANANALSTAKRWFGQWDYGFNLSWELDFWGRFRRAVEADSANLDASVEDYDDVLVTLLGDVATNYVNRRTFEQRIKDAVENVKLQERTIEIVKGLLRNGLTTELDLDQSTSILAQTQAQIPELEIGLRQASNQLCILLGIPPQQLDDLLGSAPIPSAPPEVAAGIPADLLRRRPDVRRAERQAAAQCALIGVAEAEFYPHIAVNGTFGYSAALLKNLFREKAFTGTFGPSFHWDILNYGRLRNNVRLQDARFQELVAAYQNAVLRAAQDVENGLVIFLRAQRRAKFQADSVNAADRAVKIATDQYKAGTIPLTPLTLLEQNLVQQQDTLVQAQGEIALGLIQVYRALGGGWQIRLNGCQSGPLPPAENLPMPKKETTPLPSGGTLVP